jgi:hypothetical protein
MATVDEKTLPIGYEQYEWAAEIVRQRFMKEIKGYCDESFVSKRYQKFHADHDPILYPMVEGMGDPRLQRAFVSFFAIYQTLATQSRFWLEAAISDILIHQHRRFGRPMTHLFTQNLLIDRGLDLGVGVDSIGEERLEHVTGKKEWKVGIKTEALATATSLVTAYDEKYDKGAVDLDQTQLGRLEGELLRLDRDEFCHMRTSIRGREAKPHKLHCDLLVVGPDQQDGEVRVRAFRFVNPKTFAKRADRKEERLNLLRLMAYLVQEKVFRDPETIEVQMAEIVPRRTTLKGVYGYPYFTAQSYWSADRFWNEYIGVPFRVLEWTINDIGQELLAVRLRDILPSR